MLQRKLSKKTIFSYICLGIILCFILSFVLYNLNNPTRLNKLFASVLQQAPANPAFDDENFYELVIFEYNRETGSNKAYTDSLTDEELEQIKLINWSYPGGTDRITSIKGIEKLTSLEVLVLGEHNISTVDLSNNVNLTNLVLSNNNLNEIDLSNNVNLTTLNLHNNNLNEIDLSNNVNLTSLSLGHNNLNEIDLSSNTQLTSLNLIYNNLSDIDLSNNVNLTVLDLMNNNLNEIDLSSNTQLTSLNLTYNNLSEIDLSNNVNLTSLISGANNLNSIDLSNNVNLTSLSLGTNNLSEIDLSNNVNLTYLDLRNNNLSEIDLSNNVNLVYLISGGNNLTSIDLSNNVNLTYLSLGFNNLSEIDLSNNINLTSLDLSNNNLSEIDLSNNVNLMTLYLNNNNLSEIDLSNNVDLTSLEIYGNSINHLDLSNNTNLYAYYYLSQELYFEKEKEYDNNLLTLSSENNVLYYFFETINILSLENNKLKALKVGETKYSLSYKNDYTFWASATIANIHVYEVTSNIYDIDNDLNIINIKDDDINNVLDNVNVNMTESSYKYIENGKLKICKGTNSCDKLLKEYVLVRYYSNKYDLDKKYILENDEFNENDIITSGDINIVYDVNNSKLQLTYNGVLIKELPIISYGSKKYDLTKDYIYIGNETFDLDNIEVINCEKKVDNLNFLIITHNNEEILKVPIMSYETDYEVINNYIYLGLYDFNSPKFSVVNCSYNMLEYNIDNIIRIYDNNHNEIDKIYLTQVRSNYVLSNDYIYLGSNDYDADNIDVINGYVSVSSNTFRIYDNNNNLHVSKTLIRITSDDYVINDENGYIYTKYETFDINKITKTNCEIQAYDTYIKVLYNNEEVKRYDIISIIVPNKYNLTDEYLYIRNNEFEIDQIRTINCDKNVEDNNLIITYNDEEILNVPVISYETDYEVINNYIYLGTKNFKPSNISYLNCIINEDDNKIKIIHNENVIDEIKEVKVISTYYDLSNNIIKTEKAFDIDKITVINGNKKYKDGTLIIKADDIVLKEYEVVEPAPKENDVVTTPTTIITTTTNKDDNVKTYDDIVKYFILCCASIMLIFGTVYYKRKI